MIILKVTKKQGFTLSLEDASLENPQERGEGGQFDPLSPFPPNLLRIKYRMKISFQPREIKKYAPKCLKEVPCKHVQRATDVEFFGEVFCMGCLRSYTFLLLLCVHLAYTLSQRVNHLQVSRLIFRRASKISSLHCTHGGICSHLCLQGSVAFLSI